MICNISYSSMKRCITKVQANAKKKKVEGVQASIYRKSVFVWLSMMLFLFAKCAKYDA